MKQSVAGLLLIGGVACVAAVMAPGQQAQVITPEATSAAPTTQPSAAPQFSLAAGQMSAPAPPTNAPQILAVPGQAPGPVVVQPIKLISLPDKYAILLIKSIFDRAGVATPTGGPGSMGGPGGPLSAEGQLALRGVAHDNGEFVALIEDTASHHTMQLKPGQPVGTGRVKQIDLASIEYEAGGKTKRINVGENLMGMKLPPTSQPSQGPAGPPGAVPPGAGPPGPIGPGQAMPGPPPEMAAKVAEAKARRRRGG